MRGLRGMRGQRTTHEGEDAKFDQDAAEFSENCNKLQQYITKFGRDGAKLSLDPPRLG